MLDHNQVEGHEKLTELALAGDLSMTAPKGPGTLPWIRTKETIRLIAGECGGDPIEMDRRLLVALAGGLVRCQVGSARFQLPSSSEVRRNWPVPDYVWQEEGGVLSLSGDTFTATVTMIGSAELAKDFGIAGVKSVTLLELKIHEDELRKHFQLPSRPKISKRAPMSKSSAIVSCKTWLREAFDADKNSEQRKDYFAGLALEEFKGKLSRRGFDRAWKEVTNDTIHNARAKGGRREGT